MSMAARTDHDSSVQRCGDVVRVALDLSRQREQVGVDTGEPLRRQQPRDDSGAAGAETTAQRDRGVDAELEVVRRQQALEGPHDQVLAVASQVQIGHQA